MSARMEKVRDALNRGGYVGVIRPALAEVEEWEALVALGDELIRQARDRAEAAEAERDRLREALDDIANHAFSGEDRRTARRALAAPEDES